MTARTAVDFLLSLIAVLLIAGGLLSERAAAEEMPSGTDAPSTYHERAPYSPTARLIPHAVEDGPSSERSFGPSPLGPRDGAGCDDRQPLTYAGHSYGSCAIADYAASSAGRMGETMIVEFEARLPERA